MKITLDQIQSNLAEKGWKVLSQEYKNLSADMEFECPEGHKVIMPYKKLRTKFECPVCKSNPFKNIESISVPKSKGNVTRILALDQATHISGWSLWDDDNLVKYGAFECKSRNAVERLSIIRMWLISLISNFKPDIVVLEDIQMQDFSAKSNKLYESKSNQIGVTTYKSLAELLGVLKVQLFDTNIEFKVIPSGTWRKGVGVKGIHRADRKRSAQNLVKQWFDINVTEDEADAICLGKYATKNCIQPKIIKWE